MNSKNFEYLREQVKFTGFGEGLENELREALVQGKPTFTLDFHAQYQEDYLKASLNFSKSKETDFYFFNSYKMELQKQGASQELSQQFYIHKGKNITMKEAYNLLSGRSVYKELTNQNGEDYKAWLQLDFRQTDSFGNYKMNQYHDNYGFDLSKELDGIGIESFKDQQYRDEFLDSLKKGNLQSASMLRGEETIKIFVEANPQYKTIYIYDTNNKKISQSIPQHQRKEQAQEEKKSAKVKRGTAADGESAEKPSKRKVKQSLG